MEQRHRKVSKVSGTIPKAYSRRRRHPLNQKQINPKRRKIKRARARIKRKVRIAKNLSCPSCPRRKKLKILTTTMLSWSRSSNELG